MPRNQEVIRQWKVLHALESSRHGATIDGLASELDVTTRTIRRDLAALQEAGFPLYDERDDDVLKSQYQVEIAGSRVDARATLASFYDPQSRRMRA